MDIQKFQHFLEEDPNRIRLLDIQNVDMTNDGVLIQNVSFISLDEKDDKLFDGIGGFIPADELDKILQPILKKIQ